MDTVIVIIANMSIIKVIHIIKVTNSCKKWKIIFPKVKEKG